MTIEPINFALSGGSFNRPVRRLATFTMVTLPNGRVSVTDDRPSHATIFYKPTEFASSDEAVKYWKLTDDRRTILG